MLREAAAGLALFFLLLWPAGAETLYDGKLRVSIPKDYKLIDPSEFEPNEAGPENRPKSAIPEFVSGGAKGALAKALPDTDPQETGFGGQFDRDIRAFVRIFLSDLIAEKDAAERKPDGSFWIAVPEGASDEDIHKLFCEDFSAKWGKFTFERFDAKTGIGRCINVAGAFVAVFTKKVGNSFVVVETMDLVEFLVAMSKPDSRKFTRMSDAEKWDLFKSAANSKTAEQILMSARVLR